MSYSAVQIANYFVQKGIDENNTISPMKVQKLTYIAHGWHLALTDKPLFQDKVGAWPFGPVIGSIYKAFARFSKQSISEINQDEGLPEYFPEDIESILDAVWSKYKVVTATALSNLTHKDGSPWHQVYEEGRSNIIGNDVISRYYKDMLA